MKPRCNALLLAAVVALIPTAASAAGYDDGIRDRGAWERFVAQQSGAQKDGALFWAGERSKPAPSPCRAGAGASGSEFIDGCLAARNLLTPFDDRRRSDPDYRRGWNAWVANATSPPPETHMNESRPRDCVTVDDNQRRLACYDAAFGRPADSGQPFAGEHNPPSQSATRGTETFVPGSTHQTTGTLVFGCEAPNDAAAMGQKMTNYSGSVTFLIAEAKAYGCYAAPKGLSVRFIKADADTETLLMGIPPTYVLGRGKIEQLWFAATAFR